MMLKYLEYIIAFLVTMSLLFIVGMFILFKAIDSALGLNDKVYSVSELKNEYFKNEKEIKDLIEYFNSIQPKDKSIDIEFRNNRVLERLKIDYKDSLKSDYQQWNVPVSYTQLAMVVMVLAVTSGADFTIKKSKAHNLKIWDATTKKLLFNFAVPLATGGLFCASLLYYQLHGFLAPTTLIFYGLALFNAGNYTYSDIKYLGLCEIVLGIVSLFFLGYGLFFWAIGFGVLHNVYGVIMHRKYKSC